MPNLDIDRHSDDPDDSIAEHDDSQPSGDDKSLDNLEIGDRTSKEPEADDDSAKDDGEEKTEETEETEKPEKPPKGFVNHGALHQERERRKQLQQELDSHRQQYQSELTELREQLVKFREDQKPKIDPTEDPIGYLKQKQEETELQLRQQQEAEQQRQEQTAKQQQARYAISRIQSDLRDAEDDFKEDHADYFDAVKFLQEKRTKDYEISGIPRQKHQETFAQEVLGLAVQASQQQRNPAEIVYNLAKSWGFGPSKIDNIMQGQKNSSSLSKGGTGPKTSVTDIAKMTDEEFDAYWDKLEGGSRRR